VDGTDALDMITAEVMIASKHLLTEYVGIQKGLPLCYRVHEKPSKATKERFHRQLNALKIPNSVEQFEKPSELAGILERLERMNGPIAQAVKKDIIDHFLLRTSLSADNHGHFGLRLDSYAEWKPRSADGIANQLQLAALFYLNDPLSHEEMVKRANALNLNRWKRDERTFNAILLESLYYKLSLVGSITTGTVADIQQNRVMVSMRGFSRLAALRVADSDTPLEIGSPVIAVFKGLNMRTKEYEFELA
jgi:exoribonuclease R